MYEIELSYGEYYAGIFNTDVLPVVGNVYETENSIVWVITTVVQSPKYDCSDFIVTVKSQEA